MDFVEQPTWKSGDLAVLKTTGETVIVLGPAGLGGLLEVRYPNESRNRGRFFETLMVHPFELTSKLDYLKRELEYAKTRHQLFKAAEQEMVKSLFNIVIPPDSEPSIN